MRVDLSLHLTPGEVGLFFCETTRTLHPWDTAPKTDVFSPYASVQGFVRYDLLTGVAHDAFRTYTDIEADLYTPLVRRLGTAFRVVQPFAPPRPNHLSDTYPNPFNPTTTFALILSREQQVRLEIFDLLGRRLARLHEGSLVGEESHAFRFDASALPSGIYLIRATGETFATTRPITLVK